MAYNNNYGNNNNGGGYQRNNNYGNNNQQNNSYNKQQKSLEELAGMFADGYQVLSNVFAERGLDLESISEPVQKMITSMFIQQSK